MKGMSYMSLEERIERLEKIADSLERRLEHIEEIQSHLVNLAAIQKQIYELEVGEGIKC